LKQWCIFKDQLPSNYFIKAISDLVRITTACLNRFRGPIYVSNPCCDERDRHLAERMQSCVVLENRLADRVKNGPDLSKRCKAEWQKLGADNIEFP